MNPQEATVESEAGHTATQALNVGVDQGSESLTQPPAVLARKPKSLRAAINAKCWDCQGGNSDPAPGWRIGNCVCPECPLYAVRPYQYNTTRPMPKILETGQ